MLLRRVSVTIGGLVVKINAILFSGNNNYHYLLCLRFYKHLISANQEDQHLINLAATLGSIGVWVIVTS
jgi:hypothetical protein